jgi:hypothetical protein
VVTAELEVGTGAHVRRQLGRGERLFVDVFVRTSSGRERARCSDGWVSVTAASGARLFRRVRGDDSEARRSARRAEAAVDLQLQDRGTMTCVGAGLVFTAGLELCSAIVCAVEVGEVMEIRNVARVDGLLRVRTQHGWASTTAADGTLLLALAADSERASPVSSWVSSCSSREGSSSWHTPRRTGSSSAGSDADFHEVTAKDGVSMFAPLLQCERSSLS